MINIISPGEIISGMIIMSIGAKPYKKIVSDMFGEREIEIYDRNPHFKGIPYEVMGVAGPIIAVKTNKMHNLPPVIFFDSRLVEFVEIDRGFFETYWRETLELTTPL